MYEEMIQSALEFIEDNMNNDLSLNQIAGHFSMSSYHFSRIFAFMIGEPYKQYILKRKISHSLSMLEKNYSVIDTALSYGFEYPESYARAFKQVFGLSPKQYQSGKMAVKPYGIGKIITRDLVNFKGELFIKPEYIYLEDMDMLGIKTEICLAEKGWMEKLNEIGNRFLKDTAEYSFLNQDYYYNIVRCQGNDEKYDFNFCKQVKDNHSNALFDPIKLTGGWFAQFHYKGRMNELYDCFEADIYKWISKKTEPIKVVGNGMLIIYDSKCPNEFNVLIRLERQMIN